MLHKILFSVFLAAGSCSFGADSGAQILEETSEAFTRIAEKAMPATVFIKVQISRETSDYGNPLDLYGDDFFRKFFGVPPQNGPSQPILAGGSGFLISQDGYIVTNHHVIKDAAEITVVLNDEREFLATVKGKDPRTDLALLKIEETNLPFLTFGDSDKLRVGEWVAATGNPLGLEATLTVGVVSAKGRQDIGVAAYEDFIQTDAAINPGNSGGPLLNLRCEVIGVNTAILSRSGGYMGIGLSIPSKMAEHVAQQLMRDGSVKRAYLGVVLQPVDKDLTDALSLNKQEGILVSEVIKGSPADKAGILNGDIILKYNDKPVKSVTKFRNEIAVMPPHSSLQLRILRDGKQFSLNATLGEQTESDAISAEMIQKLGLEIENLTPEMGAKLGLNGSVEGVLITKVKSGSPAANAGLRPGLLITSLGPNLNLQKKVNSVSSFEETLKEIADKKHLILITRQQNYQRYYTIKLN